MLTIGQLRNILAQIGTGHDAKPVAIMIPKGVVHLDACDVAVQGDRVLFVGVKPEPTKTFTHHADSGHGWLAVKDMDLVDVGLTPRSFSKYSYAKGGTYYLEEDCDAGKFLNAYRAKHGTMPSIVETYTNGNCAIRNYARLA